MAGGTIGGNTGGGQATPSGTVSYINLPTLGSKQSPPRFTGRYRALERFIVHYESVCIQNKVTDDREKCKGIIQYCSDEVADTIENLDSYDSGDFAKLKEDLEWLYDGSRKKSETHRGNIEDFTKLWRKEKIGSLEKFKKYHREFIRLAGVLKIAKQITESEYDQYFWSGLHRWTRDRIEKRMTDDEPSLDLSVPFPIRKVKKAAEHIFNRDRFDKYLRERKASAGRSGKPKSKTNTRPRKSRRYEDSDEDSDLSSESETETESSEESDNEPVARWRSTRRSGKTAVKSKGRVEVNTERGTDEKVGGTEENPSKEVRDEIAELTEAMEGLEITQDRYRTLYTRLNVLPVPREILDLYPQPAVPSSKSYLSQGKVTFAERARDLPPHLTTAPFDQRMRERRTEFTCYGCGESGHRMDQCNKIAALLDQGHVKKIGGRIRWKDGSMISREQDETWVKAILRRAQKEKDDDGKGGKVYIMRVRRRDSDADTDEQEGLGWGSGTSVVSDVKAYGAVRTTGVSKEVRRTIAKGSPRSPHTVEEFPNRKKLDRRQRDRLAVQLKENIDRNRDRAGNAGTMVPIDVGPEKFEGKDDGELVPMDIDKVVVENGTGEVGKLTPRNSKRVARDVVHGRPNENQPLTPITSEMLNATVTLKVRDLVSEYKSARQSLMGALKAMPRDEVSELGRRQKSRHDDEKKRLMERILDERPASNEKQKVLKAEYRGGCNEPVTLEELRRMGEIREGASRPIPIPRDHKSSLPTVLVTIGRLTVEAIIDTGSMVNMISAEKAAKTRMPTGRLNQDAFQLGGILGPESQCVRWIPPTKLYMTTEHLPTVGALFILEEGSFDVILGMPWLEKNRGSVAAREYGTYVGWKSDGKDFEVMASLGTALPIQVKTIFVEEYDGDSETDTTDTDGENQRPVTAYMAKVLKGVPTDQSYVSDSEKGRNELDYLEISSGGNESGEDAVEWARGQAEEWEDRKGKRRDHEAAERNFEYVASGSDGSRGRSSIPQPQESFTPPPNQLARRKGRAKSPEEKEVREKTKRRRKRRRTDHLEEETIEVSREMEDAFSKLIQKEADDEEWDDFWTREGIRVAKREKEWLRWVGSEDGEETPDRMTPEPAILEEVSSEPESVAKEDWSGTQERSETIRTNPEDPEPPAKRPRRTRRVLKTVEVVARRSTRERRLTEKGKYFADRVLGKRRTYRRQETASKTITQRTRPRDPAEPREEKEDCVRSYCIRWWPKKTKPNREESDRNLELRPQPRREGLRDNGRGGPSRALARVEQGSTRLAEVYDAEEVPRPRREEVPEGRLSPWNSYRYETLPVPGPNHQLARNTPVIPNLPSDLEWSGDEDLDIIRPINGLVGARNTNAEHGPATRRQWDPSARPDSEAYSRWDSAWETERRIADASGSVASRVSTEPIRPYGLRIDRLVGETNHERSRVRHSPRSITPDDLRQRQRRVKFHVPEEGGSSDEEREEEDIPSDSTGYTTPEHSLRRTRRRSNLRRYFQMDDPANEIGEMRRESSRTMAVRRPRTSGRPSQTDLTTVRVFGALCHESGEGEKDTRTTGTVRRMEDSGEGPEGIKGRLTSRRNTRPSPWLPRVLRRLKLPKTTRQRQRLLLTVSLFVSLSGNLILMSRQTLTDHSQPTMRLARRGTIDLPPSPDDTTKPRLEPFSGQGYDTTTWARNPSHAPDIARALIEHTLPASPEHAIPGLIGISHLVPFVSDICPDTLEYLGRGTTVSIRIPNGETLRHQGDVHVRFFRTGAIAGSHAVKSPSRTELDLLSKILHREAGFGDEMVHLLEKFDETKPVEEPPTGDVGMDVEGEDGDDEDDEDMTESTEDEDDDETMVVLGEDTEGSGEDDEDGAALDVMVEDSDDEVTIVINKEKLRTPPDSPPTTIKIGPPTRASKCERTLAQSASVNPNIIGPGTQRAIKSTPFRSLPVFGVEEPAKVKEEEDETSSLDFEILRPPTRTPPNHPSVSANKNLLTEETSDPAPVDQSNDPAPATRGRETGVVGTLLEHAKRAEKVEERMDEILTDESSPEKEILSALVDLVQDVKGLVNDHLHEERLRRASQAEEEHEVMKRENDESFTAQDMDLAEDGQPAVPRPNTPLPGQEADTGYASQYLVTPEEMEARVRKAEDEIREHIWMQDRKETDDDERWTQIESRLAVLEAEDTRGGRWNQPRFKRRPANRAPAGPPKGLIRKLEARVQRVEGSWQDLAIVRSRLGRVEEQVERLEELREAAGEAGKRLADLDAQIKPIKTFIAERTLRQDLLSRAAFSGKGLLSAGLLPRVNQLEAFRQEVTYRLVTLEEQIILRDRLIGAFWLTYVAPSHAETVIRANTLRSVWETATKHYTTRMESLGKVVANQEGNAALQRSTMFPFVPAFDTTAPAPADNTPSTSL